jgi:hypothetical protein
MCAVACVRGSGLCVHALVLRASRMFWSQMFDDNCLAWRVVAQTFQDPFGLFAATSPRALPGAAVQCLFSSGFMLRWKVR